MLGKIFKQAVLAIDRRVFIRCEQHRSRHLRLQQMIKWYSLSGEAGLLWFALAFMWGLWRADGLMLRQMLLVQALGYILASVVFKKIFRRDRPLGSKYREQWFVSHYSFPSGHAVSSAVAVTLAFGQTWWLGWLTLPLAMLMMASRVYLSKHYFSDVVGGAMFGASLTLVLMGFRII